MIRRFPKSLNSSQITDSRIQSAHIKDPVPGSVWDTVDILLNKTKGPRPQGPFIAVTVVIFLSASWPHFFSLDTQARLKLRSLRLTALLAWKVLL